MTVNATEGKCFLKKSLEQYSLEDWNVDVMKSRVSSVNIGFDARKPMPHNVGPNETKICSLMFLVGVVDGTVLLLLGLAVSVPHSVSTSYHTVNAYMAKNKNLFVGEFINVMTNKNLRRWSLCTSCVWFVDGWVLRICWVFLLLLLLLLVGGGVGYSFV